ncbi:MerR family transcriptional regulator [Embleya sp. NBC_00896]|uniref:MerR family transcriptional regulator n=1 Tax=Embleya sp. NBC_00896 TaxID=2975961 RepID=UPI003867DA9A|nr:MerR family transcriptional regulator [Embleya sp. NBC_00896]
MFLGIGDFARATGLTVKALRWYDEQGVLVPADVDPNTRYRRYTIDQLEQAGLIRALRAAGVPVAAVGAALREGGSPHEALRERREAVLRERAREDRAIEAAQGVLAGADLHYDVRLRPTAPQAWVGVVEYVSTPEDGEPTVVGPDGAAIDADTAIERALLDLYASLTDAGIGPTGPFWLDLGRPASDTGAEVALCLPLAAPVPEGWAVPGRRTVAGVRPAGRELTTDHVAGDDDPDHGASVHPAFAALVRAAAEQDLSIDLTTLRQHCPREVARGPEGATVTAVELSVDVEG